MKIAEVCERLQLSEEELREDVNVLNVVNFGGGSYVLVRGDQGGGGRDRGRPRALQRQLRPPRAAAAGRGEGAGRGDRPDRRAPARGLAHLRAREDRRGARRGPDGTGPAGRARRRRRLGGRARRLDRDRRAADHRAGVLQGERGPDRAAPRRALRAHERPRGLVRRLVRPRRAARCATTAWTGSRAWT